MPRLTPENLPELARLARMHNTGDHCSAPPTNHAMFVQQRRMRTSRLAYVHQFGPATIGVDFHYDYLSLGPLQDFLWGKESTPVRDRPLLTIEDQLLRALKSCPRSEGFEAIVVFHPASAKGCSVHEEAREIDPDARDCYERAAAKIRMNVSPGCPQWPPGRQFWKH